jgi:hypothetical protein
MRTLVRQMRQARRATERDRVMEKFVQPLAQAGNARTAATALRALLECAQWSAVSFAEAGGIEALFAALGAHAHVEDVALPACQLLALRLAGSPSVCAALAERSRLVVDVCRVHVCSEPVALHALSALADLTRAGHSEAVFEACGPPAIVATMRRHPRSAHILLGACEALRALACCGSLGRRACEAAGGVGAALAALTWARAQDPAGLVADAAAGALLAMQPECERAAAQAELLPALRAARARDTGEPAQEEWIPQPPPWDLPPAPPREPAEAPSGAAVARKIDNALDALMSLGGGSNAALQACDELLVLCKQPERGARAARDAAAAGCAEAVAFALARRPKDAALLRAGLVTLHALVQALPGAERRLLASRAALRALVRAAAALASHEKAAAYACATLSMLVNAGAAAEVLGAEGAAAAVEALGAHPESHEIAEHACALLADCAELHARAVARAGGLEAVAAAMCAFPDSANVQKDGALTFAHAVLGGLEVRAVEAGAIELLVAAEKRVPEAAMRNDACLVLEGVAKLPGPYGARAARGVDLALRTLRSRDSSRGSCAASNACRALLAMQRGAAALDLGARGAACAAVQALKAARGEASLAATEALCELLAAALPRAPAETVGEAFRLMHAERDRRRAAPDSWLDHAARIAAAEYARTCDELEARVSPLLAREPATPRDRPRAKAARARAAAAEAEAAARAKAEAAAEAEARADADARAKADEEARAEAAAQEAAELAAAEQKLAFEEEARKRLARQVEEAAQSARAEAEAQAQAQALAAHARAEAEAEAEAARARAEGEAKAEAERARAEAKAQALAARARAARAAADRAAKARAAAEAAAAREALAARSARVIPTPKACAVRAREPARAAEERAAAPSLHCVLREWSAGRLAGLDGQFRLRE